MNGFWFCLNSNAHFSQTGITFQAAYLPPYLNGIKNARAEILSSVHSAHFPKCIQAFSQSSFVNGVNGFGTWFIRVSQASNVACAFLVGVFHILSLYSQLLDRIDSHFLHHGVPLAYSAYLPHLLQKPYLNGVPQKRQLRFGYVAG